MTVTFNTYGGSVIASKEIKQDASVTRPDDPTKANYLFDGWYTSTEYTTEWNFDDAVTESMVLHAKWATDFTALDPSTLAVGDTIDAPSTYGFRPITFRVVDKGHVSVDGSTNTVTLQADNVLTLTGGSAYTRTFDDSSNKWSESDIATWLNGDLLNAFLKDSFGSTKTRTAATNANAFLNILKKPTLSTWVYGTESTARETKADWKVWLPSYTQMGGSGSSYAAVEDECFDYYKNDDNITPIGDGSSTKRLRSLISGTSGCDYWLRSASTRGSGKTAWLVMDKGELMDYGGTFTYPNNAVSPLITLTY